MTDDTDSPTSRKDALVITNRVRIALDRAWELLLGAYEQQAWAALGYPSWRDYITDNFRISVRHDRCLLDYGSAVTAIEEAAGFKPFPRGDGSMGRKLIPGEQAQEDRDSTVTNARAEL